MTGFWANDRDTLADGLSGHIEGDVMCSIAADELIATGVVRVLDPDDTELVEQVAQAIYTAHVQQLHKPGSEAWLYPIARAVIVALRQP
jgi:hypothetical protein